TAVEAAAQAAPVEAATGGDAHPGAVAPSHPGLGVTPGGGFHGGGLGGGFHSGGFGGFGH
ncbi:hypothetical protein C5E45_26905, partial [Nocardia nova]